MTAQAVRSPLILRASLTVSAGHSTPLLKRNVSEGKQSTKRETREGRVRRQVAPGPVIDNEIKVSRVAEPRQDG